MVRELARVAGRCAALLAVVGSAGAAMWPLAAEPALALAGRLSAGADGLAGMPFDEALTGVCSLALAACTAWLVLVTCLLTGEALSGTVTRRPVRLQAHPWLCPSGLRRLVLAGCGVAVATGLAGGPALADPADSGPASPASASALSGLGVPDRTVGRGGSGSSGSDSTVRVRAGDCLWALAKRALPENAADAEVVAAWHAIHRANPARIDDPDLIFPGTPLRIPDLDRSPRKESS